MAVTFGMCEMQRFIMHLSRIGGNVQMCAQIGVQDLEGGHALATNKHVEDDGTRAEFQLEEFAKFC